MPKITFNGQEYWVPGVYSREEVVSYLAGASAAFHVPMLLGGSDVGYPYDFDSKKNAAEDPRGPFTYCGTTSALTSTFGQDSDLATAFKFGKRHGLPYAYVACMGDLTRASVPVHSAGAVVQGTLCCDLFGSPGGWHKFKSPGGVVTITPCIRHTLLTVTTTALDKRVYVRDNSWIVAGQSLEIGDVNSVNVAKIVSTKGDELSSTGQKVYWVEFTAAVGAVYATGDYAQLGLYDETQNEVSGTLTTGQEFADFINNTSKYLKFFKAVTWTGVLPIAVAVSVPLKELAGWGTPVPGTSPAPVLADYNDLITDLDGGAWEDFIVAQEVIPRLFCVACNLSTVHASFRDWAIAKRAEGNPIEVVTGAGWGDVLLTGAADTNITYRSANLNSQDVAICAGGLDWIESALSLAPAVWGMIAAGGTVHNLTQDPLTFTSKEVTWDERNAAELTTLHKKGCITYRLSIDNRGAQWVISEGINTLQNNAEAWNTGTNDTPLIMQRNVADYVQRDMRFTLVQTQLGGNIVNRDTVAIALTRRADVHIKSGALTAYTIQSIALNATGSGWDVTDSHKYPTTTDFLTITTQVVIGEE